MILTEEEIGKFFDYGFTTKEELAIARAIEQAILDKLQDKLKNAERYEWLRRNADWFDWDIVVQPSWDYDDPCHFNDSLKIDNCIDFVMGNGEY